MTSASSSPKRLCVVGSLNADLVVRAARLPRPGETVRGSSVARVPGGKGANQACAAARLVAGDPGMTIAVSMVGQIGEDEHGPWLREGLRAAGVDVEGVVTVPGAPSGVAVVTVDATGANQIVIIPGANDAFVPGALTPHHHRVAAADVLLLQLEIPLPTVQTAARVGREKGAVVILDPAPARPLPDGLLRICDYVTPNESELALLVGLPPPEGALSVEAATAGARQLLSRGARNVVVKLGAAGALLVGASGAHHFPAFPVTAVDTTAAGDAWNGAFAVALAEGKDPLVAGTFACAAAALSVTRPGAQPSLPRREEVEALLGAPAA